jgi:type II secretory pathway component GspD/PulD (secretin)
MKATTLLVWLAVLAVGQAESPDLDTRTYPVQPGVFRSLVEIPHGTNQPLAVTGDTVQKFFQDCGVAFPPGASVTYNDRLSMLVVKNTPENIKLFHAVVRQLNIEPTQVSIEARFLQMTHETANDLFKPEPTLGRVSVIKEEILRRIRELENLKKITVLAQPKVTTVSGNTAQVKSIEEYRYATEHFTPPSIPTNAPGKKIGSVSVVPGGFETREIGTLLNVTPTLGPEGQTLNLSLVPEISQVATPHKIEVVTPDGKTTVEQPRFRSRQVTTTVQMLSGTTILVAVADPVQGEDPDQVVLILLTATVVGIQ